MFSNKPVPRFRRKHQVNHWRHGLYLPYQVLVLVFTLLLAPSVLAEKEYYTWVDEFGRVHNTLIDPTSKKESKKSASKLPPVDTNEYMTEEDYERQAENDRSENPSTHTWVDEQGRIHNQAVPKVDVRIDEEVEFQPQVTDHTLVPPLRLR